MRRRCWIREVSVVGSREIRVEVIRRQSLLPTESTKTYFRLGWQGEIRIGGLGAQFGFVESRRWQDCGPTCRARRRGFQEYPFGPRPGWRWTKCFGQRPLPTRNCEPPMNVLTPPPTDHIHVGRSVRQAFLSRSSAPVGSVISCSRQTRGFRFRHRFSRLGKPVQFQRQPHNVPLRQRRIRR